MKSFSQFLQESYLSEEEARQFRLMKRDDKTPYKLNKPSGSREFASDPTPTPASRRLSAATPEAPKPSPGQLEIPKPKTTKVSGSQFRNAGDARQGSFFTRSGGPQNFTGGRTPFVATDPVKGTKKLPAGPETPKTSAGQMEIDFNARSNRGGKLAKRPTSTPSAPVGTPSNPERIYPTPVKNSTSTGQKALPAAGQTSAPKSSSSARQKALPAAGQTSAPKPEATSSGGKLPSGSKFKIPTGAKKALRIGGKLLGPAAAALDVADEKSKGSGWARSLAKGATVAAGGALGGAVGSVGGPVGSIAGATGGSMAASKAFDVAAGANAKERKAMATANRQRQAGTAIKGIGGKTTFDTKKNTMTTGTGAQRKTVGLAKTGVVQRGGQSVSGHLAYKGGKAVYKAGPSAQSLAKTSSNPLERIGRSLFAGAYKKSDAAAAARKLSVARASDVARNKALGVKALPGK